jgi:hypothetical protein
LLTEKNLDFFSFYGKVDKPVKAVIRPGNISGEDVIVTIQEIDCKTYDVPNFLVQKEESHFCLSASS